jgi:hypothetical protein
MWQGLALIVPTIGKIGSEVRPPHQARTRHAKARESRRGQIVHVNAEPLGLLAVLDSELQQTRTFAGVAKAGAWIEVNSQLLIRLNKPEVVEAGLLHLFVDGASGGKSVCVAFCAGECPEMEATSAARNASFESELAIVNEIVAYSGQNPSELTVRSKFPWKIQNAAPLLLIARAVAMGSVVIGLTSCLQ